MIEPRQLRDYVVIPTLSKLPKPMWSEAAVQLLMGTVMQESQCGRYLHQVRGPACGAWQMEPATANDHFRWAASHPDLWSILRENFGPLTVEHLDGNLNLACAMARLHYWRRPEPLPHEDDILGQARYYKQWYNTPAGAATVEQYIDNWRRLQDLL